MVEKEWNYEGNNNEWKTNYTCFIEEDGLWQIESDKYNKRMGGKWLFKVIQKPGSPTFPTMADQNNFMSGLLEVDWHNDTFKCPDGSTRCSSMGHEQIHEFKKRLRIFQQVLDYFKTKYGGQLTLDFYD